jgi:hypothetical protein
MGPGSDRLKIVRISIVLYAASRVVALWSTLREICRAGRLRFDLEPKRLFRDGKVVEEKIGCDNP